MENDLGFYVSSLTIYFRLSFQCQAPALCPVAFLPVSLPAKWLSRVNTITRRTSPPITPRAPRRPNHKLVTPTAPRRPSNRPAGDSMRPTGHSSSSSITITVRWPGHRATRLSSPVHTRLRHHRPTRRQRSLCPTPTRNRCPIRPCIIWP